MASCHTLMVIIIISKKIHVITCITNKRTSMLYIIKPSQPIILALIKFTTTPIQFTTSKLKSIPPTKSITLN